MKNIKFSSSKQRESFHLLTNINRDICKPHVRTLEQSIQLIGEVTRPIITARFGFIDGTKRRYVIDGQHLLEACVNLDKEIPWMEIDIKNEEDLIEKIAKLNASSKSWILSDYVKSWAWLDGKEDYKKLLRLHNSTKLSVNVLAMNLALVDVRNSRKENVVKSGKFKIDSVRVGTACANHFADVLKAVPNRGIVPTRLLAKVFSHWYHEHSSFYNHPRFLSYVSKHRDTIRVFADDNDEAQEFMNGFGGKSRIIDVTAFGG